MSYVPLIISFIFVIFSRQQTLRRFLIAIIIYLVVFFILLALGTISVDFWILLKIAVLGITAYLLSLVGK